MKMSFYQYGKSHCRDKKILWPSCLNNDISCTGKMASLYRIRAQLMCTWILRTWLTHWGRVTAPSDYLNQCWDIVNWALGNKLQWKFNQNSNISFKKMHLKMSSVKWRPFYLGLNVLMCMLNMHLVRKMQQFQLELNEQWCFQPGTSWYALNLLSPKRYEWHFW